MKVLRYLPFYLLSLVPIPLLQVLADLLYFPVYHLIRYRRQVVRDNLRRSFPHEDETGIAQRERAFYRHFSQMFILSVKVLTISPRQARERVRFRNIELIDAAYERGENVVLYGAHMGNWEWFAFFPLHIRHQFVSFYQEQTNAYFNGLSILMRERFGNRCLESRTAYKNLVNLNRQGVLTFTYILGDQSPMANSSMSWHPFLERQTAFLVGAGRIATKLRHRVFYPYVRMPRRNYYEVEFIELPNSGDQDALIGSYTALLERNIREQSELWLWTHRRWKVKPEPDLPNHP